MSETPSIDALLENATWLRALARGMLADRGLADDALQETWVAALRERPEVGSERPWLARVLRNFALQRKRAESARSSREQRASRSERLPGADEIVTRAELHARLVQAVLALEEPYRTTILWRYFEGLSAEEIARRATIEPATVRSRVARAREKLRAALMANGGEAPERWLGALLPVGARLIEIPTAVSAGALAVAGGSMMNAKLILGAASIALVAMWFVYRGSTSEDTARLSDRPPPASADSKLESSPLEHGEGLLDAPGRLAVETAPPAREASASESSHWQGVVLSEDGRLPIEGARVAYRRGSELGQYSPEERSARTRDGVRSDAQGRFALEIPAKTDDGLWVEAEGFIPFKLSPGDLPRAGATPIEIVLAPLGTLELEVVDEAMQPYADMPVQYMIDMNRGSQDYMWTFRGWRNGGSTDSAGRVTIGNLPCGMPLALRQDERTGQGVFLASAIHIDPHSRLLHHVAKLSRNARLTGKLEFADGRAAASIVLAWKGYPLDYDQPIVARSESDGRFTLVEVRPKPGELQLEFPGATAVRLTPQQGETTDLGTIVVAEPLELAGHLTSRWFEGADIEQALSGVEVRAFRAGRVLVGASQRDSMLRRKANEFSGQATDGPLEIVVSRGGFFFAGISQPGEVLARLEFPGPRGGLEISIDERTGALDLQLEPRPTAKGQVLKIELDALDEQNPDSYPFRAEGIANEAGLVRFAALPTGRFRCMLQTSEGESAAVDEVTIAAGQCASLRAMNFARVSLHGRVLDARGEPIEHASVRCRSRREDTTTTDGAGRFSFDGLAAGIYDVEVSHGDHGVLRRRAVRVFSSKDPPIEFVLGGFSSLVGHVRSHGSAASGLAVSAQPVDSNDSYSSITDERGVFHLEHLPACRLRVWASGKFMEIHDLAAGEAREIEIDLGEVSELRFTRNGEPVLDLEGVRALAIDGGKSGRSEWRLAELHGAIANIDLPSGRVLFDVARSRSGSNESFLALVDHPGASVELARQSITIEGATAWNGPLPRAMLISIEGREVISMWGGVIVLATERDDQGRVIVPCLPEHSRVRIVGFDSKGERFEQIVDAGGAPVRWP